MTPTPTGNLISENFQQYGLFRIQLTKPAKVGYAIQVAQMATYGGMTRKIDDLQAASLQNIMVNIERGKDGNPDYRVLLGAFSTPTEAASFLKSKKLKGFIVDLKGLK